MFSNTTIFFTHIKIVLSLLLLISIITACTQPKPFATSQLTDTATHLSNNTSPISVIQHSVIPTPTNTPTLPPTPTFPPSPTPPPTSTPTPTFTPTSTYTPKPTFTPTSTMTPDPNRTPLPDLIGINDNPIKQLDDNKYNLSQTTSITFNNQIYQAFIFNKTKASTPTGYIRRLLIYQTQVETQQTTLLMDSQNRNLRGLKAVGIIYSIDMEKWGDLNQDGNPDLVVFYHNGGNAWVVNQQVHLWQIEDDGSLIDLTTPIYETYNLIPQRSIEDRNNDDILDLWVADVRGEWYGSSHAGGVLSFKIYAWQNDKVEDISNQFTQIYDEDSNRAIKYIKSTYTEEIDKDTAINITAAAFNVLINYENSHRRDEGWLIYQELTAPQNWTSLDSEALDVITRRRKRHTSQYQANERFK